jgi:tRNA(Ile2) C34 agmatinyltransferase TiaS
MLIIEIDMARCKKCGTVKKHIGKSTNWKLWQLCRRCAREEHPEQYKGTETLIKIGYLMPQSS